MDKSLMRSAVFFSLCLGVLTLSGCAGAFDPYQRPNQWSETGAPAETIAQQAANKADLIQGHGDNGTNGLIAVSGIDKALGTGGTGPATGLQTALTPTAPGGTGGD